MPSPEASLYSTIYRHFRTRILSGELPPGSRLPTERELEALFKVSRITASRALRELELEGYILRRKGSGSYVTEGGWKAPGETGARPGTGRESLKEALSFISLVIPLGDKFSHEVFEGIEEVARRRGSFVTFHDSSFDTDREKAIVEDVLAKGARGVILYPSSEIANLDLLSGLLIGKFPFVVMDRRVPGLDTPLVSVDNREGFRAVTRHLLELGHRRIAFVGSSVQRISSEMERYRGFCQAHVEAGVPLPRRHLFLEEERDAIPPEFLPDEREESREAQYFLRLLEGLDPGERPTAIAAVNDFTARELLQAASRLGLSVPGDYSISGFDDLSFASHLSVPLTTVRQPAADLGKAAAELLFALLDGSVAGTPERIIPSTLVVRESTGAPRGASRAGPGAERRIAP